MSALVLPYHHPVRIAKALATLDVISKGRVLCGIGVGWMEDEFNRLGVPFTERGAITDEYLRAMQVLWTEETPRFIGRYVAFAEARSEQKPVQRPYSPLLIGGSGPRALRRAVELGDGWYPMTGNPAEVRAGIAPIRELALARGPDPAALLFGYTGIPVIADEDTARAAAHVRGARDVPSDRRLSRDGAMEVMERYAEAEVQFLLVGFAWRAAGQPA